MWSGVDPVVTLIEFDITWSWEVSFAPLHFTAGARIFGSYKMGGWVSRSA